MYGSKRGARSNLRSYRDQYFGLGRACRTPDRCGEPDCRKLPKCCDLPEMPGFLMSAVDKKSGAKRKREAVRKVGYCRVSSTHQNLDRQIGALRAERVEVIYREKASDKSVKRRPELERAIDELGT